MQDEGAKKQDEMEKTLLTCAREHDVLCESRTAHKKLCEISSELANQRSVSGRKAVHAQPQSQLSVLVSVSRRWSATAGKRLYDKRANIIGQPDGTNGITAFWLNAMQVTPAASTRCHTSHRIRRFS